MNVSQVRVRRSGPKTFADVVLQVSRGLSVERAHEIAHAAEDSIRRAVLDVDVMVHTEPDAEH
jgi:divalent metal cation (Fe/Co/Zn/Cd) transporter